MIKKTAHLVNTVVISTTVNTAVPGRATLKESLYDKALADQIRKDLQLVPSWLSLPITAHCGK